MLGAAGSPAKEEAWLPISFWSPGTIEGMRTVRDAPKRSEGILAAGERMGVRVVEWFHTVAPFDFLMKVEAADRRGCGGIRHGDQRRRKRLPRSITRPSPRRSGSRSSPGCPSAAAAIPGGEEPRP